MQVLWSTAGDVFHNLALEDWWLDRFDAQGPVLLFYVNQPAIVVGKNQHPWREAAIGWARCEGVSIARRVSGGGAVYHDAGNLNFSLILPRGEYRQTDVFAQTIAALADQGIAAELRGGNSLYVCGKKVSGTAFCFRGGAAMHHGTLLVCSDLQRLRAALKPELPELETRAIPSKPAPVCNLADFRPELTMASFAQALAARLAGGAAPRAYEGPDDPRFHDRMGQHRSSAWVFGHTPSFSCNLPCGRLEVERGCIARAIGPNVPATWIGLPFDPNGPWRDVLQKSPWADAPPRSSH